MSGNKGWKYEKNNEDMFDCINYIFLWTEVWINLFMRRLYTICQWGYNNVIYKIFLYSHSIDTYLRIILEGVILYCGLKMIKEIMHKIDNL